MPPRSLVTPARLVLAMLSLALLLHPAGVAADGDARPVRLLNDDPEWLAALRVALEPWGLTVEPTVQATTTRSGLSRGRAHRAAAAAVVWIEAGDPPRLFVYLPEDDRLLERSLRTAPPYDAPQAAAVALTVKTLLRQTPLAPSGAPPRPSASPVSPTTIRLGVAAALRGRSLSPGGAEGRIAGLISVWPRLAGAGVGFGVRVEGGPPLSLSRPESGAGSWRDTTTLATVAVALKLAPWLDAAVSVEGGLRVLGFRLRLAAPDERTADRVEPAIRALASLGFWPVPVLRVALEGGVVLAPIPADFVEEDMRVAREETVSGFIGVTVAVAMSVP